MTKVGSARARLRSNVEIALQPLLDLAARGGANLLGDWLSTLEQEHRRDSADAVAARDVRILVDIELGDSDLVAKIVGDFLKRRGDHSARAAPFRPEVHQNRSLGAQYVGSKALVGDSLGGHDGESPCQKLTNIWAVGAPLSRR